jgi:DNA-binding MarR family transcriptional regulator
MPYDTENVLTSEKPYTVFREIAMSEDGSYGLEIARELDMKQQLASEIVNNLEKAGVITKGKRTRAQYYEIDPEGLNTLFWSILGEEIQKSSSQSLESCLQEIIQESSIKDESRLKETVREFFTKYLEFYLNNWEKSTIRKMLVDDLFTGINGISPLEEAPDWIFILKDLGDLRRSYLEDKESAVRWALQRTSSPKNVKEINEQKEKLAEELSEKDIEPGSPFDD